MLRAALLHQWLTFPSALCPWITLPSATHSIKSILWKVAGIFLKCYALWAGHFFLKIIKSSCWNSNYIWIFPILSYDSFCISYFSIHLISSDHSIHKDTIIIVVISELYTCIFLKTDISLLTVLFSVS